MRLVTYRDGMLELRWTWLPYWIATGSALHNEIDTYMRDLVIINGVVPTDEALLRIEKLVLKMLDQRFKITGLTAYLEALSHVHEA